MAKEKTKPAERPRKREEVSPYIGKSGTFGFLKINNITLMTRTEAQFDEILTDDTKWAELKKLMDADFADELEMFPYQEEKDTPPLQNVNWIERISIRTGNFLKKFARASKLSVIELPGRYHARRYYT